MDSPAFCYLTTTGRRTGRPGTGDLDSWGRSALVVAIEVPAWASTLT